MYMYALYIYIYISFFFRRRTIIAIAPAVTHIRKQYGDRT